MESPKFYNQSESKKEETPSSQELSADSRLDQEEADRNVQRQLEGITEDNKNAPNENLREYIEEHRDLFKSRNQIITLSELEEIGEEVPRLKSYIEDNLIPICIRYTETVAEFDAWLKQYAKGDMTAEEFEEKGKSRSRTHDSMIVDFKIIIREARKEIGEQNWMNKFEGGRATYAKLALQLTAEKLLAKK